MATWSVRARTRDGKRTRPTLGTWPTVGISEARERARQQLAAIRGGADPVLEKRAARAERAARAAEPTVADRMAEWLAAREADPDKPLRPRTADEVEGHAAFVAQERERFREWVRATGLRME